MLKDRFMSLGDKLPHKIPRFFQGQDLILPSAYSSAPSDENFRVRGNLPELHVHNYLPCAKISLSKEA
jgi:hypothetical protein